MSKRGVKKRDVLWTDRVLAAENEAYRPRVDWELDSTGVATQAEREAEARLVTALYTDLQTRGELPRKLSLPMIAITARHPGLLARLLEDENVVVKRSFETLVQNSKQCSFFPSNVVHSDTALLRRPETDVLYNHLIQSRKHRKETNAQAWLIMRCLYWAIWYREERMLRILCKGSKEHPGASTAVARLLHASGFMLNEDMSADVLDWVLSTAKDAIVRGLLHERYFSRNLSMMVSLLRLEDYGTRVATRVLEPLLASCLPRMEAEGKEWEAKQYSDEHALALREAGLLCPPSLLSESKEEVSDEPFLKIAKSSRGWPNNAYTARPENAHGMLMTRAVMLLEALLHTQPLYALQKHSLLAEHLLRRRVVAITLPETKPSREALLSYMEARDLRCLEESDLETAILKHPDECARTRALQRVPLSARNLVIKMVQNERVVENLDMESAARLLLDALQEDESVPQPDRYRELREAFVRYRNTCAPPLLCAALSERLLPIPEDAAALKELYTLERKSWKQNACMRYALTLSNFVGYLRTLLPLLSRQTHLDAILYYGTHGVPDDHVMAAVRVLSRTTNALSDAVEKSQTDNDIYLQMTLEEILHDLEMLHDI